jgi:outer membrane immunogenic protein
MKRLAVVVASVAALGFVSSANAADMPAKAPVYKAPAAVSVYNWTGFYVGGDLGWQSSSIGLSGATLAGAPFPLTYSPTHSSVAYGGFLGYQHQFGQFVLGIEGGYTAATGSASLGQTPSLPIFTPGGTGTAQAKLKDIWNVGGRVGWAMGPMGNWMPYLTGGYAVGRFGFDGQTPGFTETAIAKPSGAYFGGGLEWAAWRNVIAGSDLILGVEYRHYSFGTKDTIGTRSDGFLETIRFDTKTDTVMGRVSLKFGN